jgi:DNA-dependent RNA polymerase
MTTIQTIFAVFSVPNLEASFVGSFYNIVGYMYSTDQKEEFDYNHTCDIFNTLNINIKSIGLITITDNPKITEIKKIIYSSKNNETILINHIVPKFLFWTKVYLLNYLTNKNIYYEKELLNYKSEIETVKVHPNFIIYKFENCSWNEITAHFKSFNFSLGGGSFVKRHIINPLHLRLNLFLITLEKEDIIDKVTYNFHNVGKEYNRTYLNYKLTYEEMIKQYNKLRYILEQEKNKLENNSNYASKKNYFLNISVLIEQFDNLSNLIKQIESLKKINFKEDNILITQNNLNREELNEDYNKNQENYKDAVKKVNDNKNKDNEIVNSNNINKTIGNDFNPFLNGQKREFHSTKCINQIGISNDKIILNKKLNELLNNNTIKEIFINEEFEIINEILSSGVLSNEEKQLKIENFYYSEFSKKLEEDIKKPNFLNISDGQKLLHKAFKELDDNLNELKKDKKNFKNKSYGYIIANSSNSLIISAVFSIIIPYIYKNFDVLSQNYSSLILKVGKSVYKGYLRDLYSQYWTHIKNTNKINYKKFEKENIFITDFIVIDKISGKESKIKFEDNKTYLDYIEFIDKIDFIKQYSDEDPELFKLGHFLIQFINDKQKDFFSVLTETTYEKNKIITRNFIKPGEHIEDLFKMSFFNITNMPMIRKPIEWVIEIKNENEYKIKKYGGFLSNRYDRKHFIHRNLKNLGTIKLINDKIINTLNYIQSIPFIVNLNVLYHILNLIKEGKQFEEPLLFFYHSETVNLKNFYAELTNEKEKSKIKELKIKIYEILRHNSYVNINISTISTAVLLRNEVFYHPTFLDWRGRIYIHNTLLSFQGNELNRSLLYFKNGNVLNESGIKALKIYTANCFGLNKKSYNYKLKWIEDNLNEILNIESEFWMQAKEKLIFLACCYELKGYYNDPINFISRLPITKDLTANGLQHLAAISKDLNLARYVNLLKSTTDEEPNDVYTYLTNKVKEIIIKETSNNKLPYLKFLNITRDIAKIAIMTIPYGAKIKGIKDQIIDKFFIKTSYTVRYYFDGKTKQKLEKVSSLYKPRDLILVKDNYEMDKDNFNISGTEIMFLAKTFYNTLYEVYPSVKILVDYLKSINDCLHELGLNLGFLWRVPSGLIIEQKYMITKISKHSTFISGKRKIFNLLQPTEKVNKLKQKDGIVASLIHSMDASNIALLINKIREINWKVNLVTVHDCFITDANHCEFINFRVKAAFISLYQDQNFIDEFHNNFINYLKKISENNQSIILFCNDTKILYEKPIKTNKKDNKILKFKQCELVIPKKPIFNDNLNLNNILNSTYFLI